MKKKLPLLLNNCIIMSFLPPICVSPADIFSGTLYDFYRNLLTITRDCFPRMKFKDCHVTMKRRGGGRGEEEEEEEEEGFGVCAVDCSFIVLS